ncbi:MAG: hypothetical protein VKN56_00390 [Cyanobacteriota bacterium]|nr:hypothetical protein [Cyanobacteriota bacterium]
MNLNDRPQAGLRPDPSAVEKGIRLALWQGKGAGYAGNSLWGRLGDRVRVARSEPSLLQADCLASEHGETHPTCPRSLEDLRTDLFSCSEGSNEQEHTKRNGSSQAMVSTTTTR